MTAITLTPAERSHLLLALSFVESELPEHDSLLRKLEAGAPSVWQPIETAPRCGKAIRVGWWDEHGEWNESIDFYSDGDWHNHQDYYNHYTCVRTPGIGMVGPSESAPYTHWMPLPEPPPEPEP